MEYTIRHLEDYDIQQVGQLFNYEDISMFSEHVPHNHSSYWKNQFRIDPNSTHLVADCDGQTVAHLSIFTNPAPRKKHVAKFSINVHPDFQGQGIGKRLLEELINLCDNWLNISRIELEVFTENERAITLYKKFGFEIEGTALNSCFVHGELKDSHTMARVLQPSQGNQ